MTQACYLDPEGNPPSRGDLWKNPTMAAMFERLLAEGEVEAAAALAAGGGGAEHGAEAVRQAEIEAVRRIWREGFVADAVALHCEAEHFNQRTGDNLGGLQLHFAWGPQYATRNSKSAHQLVHNTWAGMLSLSSG